VIQFSIKGPHPLEELVNGVALYPRKLPRQLANGACALGQKQTSAMFLINPFGVVS
jgi:hypothetical protein